jgi:Protein of unknown function (DUF2975)
MKRGKAVARIDPVALAGVRANWKLTEPLGCAVSFILVFIASLVVAALLTSPWTKSSIDFYGFTAGPACASVPLNGLSETGGGSTIANLRPQTSAGTGRQVSLCASHPTFGQRTLVTLTQAPAAVLYLAILLLLWQLIRAIRRDGPFADLVARRLRFLAWFILAGSAAVAAGQSMAQSAFASTIVTDPVPAASNVTGALTDGLVLPVLITCGLLTLARVIGVGARMRDDLAGTV